VTDDRLTPETLAAYVQHYPGLDEAREAAARLALAWVTTIAVVPNPMPDSTGYVLFDLGADLDGDMAARAVAMFNPDIGQLDDGTLIVPGSPP
jgi:hypothetical protein